MGYGAERRVRRFFPAVTGPKLKYKFGFVQEYEGRTALISDVIEKEAMEAAAYVQAAMKISMDEVLGMNIYEFCRMHQQARKAQAEEAERLRRQEKNTR